MYAYVERRGRREERIMWQYQTISLGGSGFLWASFDWNELNSRLNRLGAEGWELVSVMDINRHEGGTAYVVAFLKRWVGETEKKA